MSDFIHNQRGAVTTDWVALSALAAALAFAAAYSIFSNGLAPIVGNIIETLRF